jgi:hypothetical protein
MNWLKNPMVMMVGLPLVLMFMMKRMPKPDQAEMQQQQEQMSNCMKQQQ